MKSDSEHIKAIRKKLNLTQAQMAMFMGLSRSYVAELESGSRPITDQLLHKLNKVDTQISHLNASPRLTENNKENADYFDYLDASLASMTLKEYEQIVEYFYKLDYKAPEFIRPFYEPILNSISKEMIKRMGVGKTELDKKHDLTGITLKSNTEIVKSEIQKLIERVKSKAEKQPGAKAELARLLGVAPARISEWLSGAKEPGGEYTLRLLKWVEQS